MFGAHVFVCTLTYVPTGVWVFVQLPTDADNHGHMDGGCSAGLRWFEPSPANMVNHLASSHRLKFTRADFALSHCLVSFTSFKELLQLQLTDGAVIPSTDNGSL